MSRAEAAITIKQNKEKQRGVHLYNKRMILHCLIMAQRLVNILSKALPNRPVARICPRVVQGGGCCIMGPGSQSEQGGVTDIDIFLKFCMKTSNLSLTCILFLLFSLNLMFDRTQIIL